MMHGEPDLGWICPKCRWHNLVNGPCEKCGWEPVS